MLGLDIAYMRAKFDQSSFSHSGDMVGAHQNLNGSRDLTAPLSGIVGHPWANTCYDQPIGLPNLKSLSVPTTKIQKVIKIAKMGWFGVVRGHSMSVEIAPFDRAHTSSY